MKCLECGTEMHREIRDYDYTDVPGVVLKDLVWDICPECGEYEVEIPQILELHRTLATMLLRKESRLIPAEIRFLRSHLGWSGAEFARRFGVTPETVSRWEHGKKNMSATSERLLRVMAVVADGVIQKVPVRLSEPARHELRVWFDETWKAAC